MTSFAASAPGKVILLGEHGVNRGQPALAAAIDRRGWCRVTPRPSATFVFRSGDCHEEIERDALHVFKEEIDRCRSDRELDQLRARTADDFFAPVRYVLADIAERYELPTLDITWRSELPLGAGVGSGAAASTAMAWAAIQAAGHQPEPDEVAYLAWQGDVIAHGGVASGLDSGASTLGGVTWYTLDAGPRLARSQPLTLVVADTGIQAKTADINTRVRHWLAAHPARIHLFTEMGMLVAEAAAALATGDLERLGRLMNLNQLVLEKLGVSCPEIEQLVEAAQEAGALGAKLAGSGGGGIVIALPGPGEAERIAAAMTEAGGATMIVAAGTEGVRSEMTDMATVVRWRHGDHHQTKEEYNG